MSNYQLCTPTQLGQAAIGVAASTVYTAGALVRAMVKDINIANTGTTAVNVTVYLVPSGGTAGASNELIPNMQLAASGSQGAIFQWSGTQVIHPGGTIQVVASATGCTITVSGAECV